MKKIFLLCFLIIFISGCATMIPKSWPEHFEVFPTERIQSCFELPGGACRQSLFNFTYDEVYASTVKALSFAQINVTAEDMDKGFIYGMRSKRIESGFGTGNVERHYFRVAIEELEAEKCRVTAQAKMQTQGRYMPYLYNLWLPTIGTALFIMATTGPEFAAIALVIPVVIAPINYLANSKAKENSEVKWSKYDDEDLDRIMSYIRTDLLQQ